MPLRSATLCAVEFPQGLKEAGVVGRQNVASMSASTSGTQKQLHVSDQLPTEGTHHDAIYLVLDGL
jgi:hypothetical protein